MAHLFLLREDGSPPKQDKQQDEISHVFKRGFIDFIDFVCLTVWHRGQGTA